jgi:hypothetical protein
MPSRTVFRDLSRDGRKISRFGVSRLKKDLEKPISSSLIFISRYNGNLEIFHEIISRSQKAISRLTCILYTKKRQRNSVLNANHTQTFLY